MRNPPTLWNALVSVHLHMPCDWHSTQLEHCNDNLILTENICGKLWWLYWRPCVLRKYKVKQHLFTKPQIKSGLQLQKINEKKRKKRACFGAHLYSTGSPHGNLRQTPMGSVSCNHFMKTTPDRIKTSVSHHLIKPRTPNGINDSVNHDLYQTKNTWGNQQQ